MIIQIDITDKHCKVMGAPVIVCGNSGYSIAFTFDEEWDAEGAKTARFVYVQNGAVKHTDVIFTGSTVEVPILRDIKAVRVGVFAGDLKTSTPARIPCERSILCGTSTQDDITPSQYEQILALLGAIASALDELHNYAQGLINGGEA